jgi:hypothetical protein
LNEETITELIASAQQRVVFASASISEKIADAIVSLKERNPAIKLHIIIDASYETLRLGFGEYGGIKLLLNEGIDVRCSSGLKIGAFVVDDLSWIFAPTAQIILPLPGSAEKNAILGHPELVDWLLLATAPEDLALERAKKASPEPLKKDDDHSDEVLEEEFIVPSDEVDDDDPLAADVITEQEPTKAIETTPFVPEIGTTLLTSEQLEEIHEELEERPPKEFEAERELQVYDGYLQFVDLEFSGGRLAARTVQLPNDLLEVADDADLRIKIKASCQLFENTNVVFSEVREFEQKVFQLRKKYIKSLGKQLGCVLLTRHRKKFDEELEGLRAELNTLNKGLQDKLRTEIENSRKRLMWTLVPLVIDHPPQAIKEELKNALCVFYCAAGYIARQIETYFPRSDAILARMQIRCTFKDVTWEMLNEKEFGDAIRRRFRGEKFAKLYSETIALGQRKESKPAPPKESDKNWPDSLDDVTEPR